MKCPWCEEWEGTPEEYSEHLEKCPAREIRKIGVARETQIYILEPKELAEKIRARAERVTRGDLFIDGMFALIRDIKETSSNPGYWDAVIFSLEGGRLVQRKKRKPFGWLP